MKKVKIEWVHRSSRRSLIPWHRQPFLWCYAMYLRVERLMNKPVKRLPPKQRVRDIGLEEIGIENFEGVRVIK